MASSSTVLITTLTSIPYPLFNLKEKRNIHSYFEKNYHLFQYKFIANYLIITKIYDSSFKPPYKGYNFALNFFIASFEVALEKNISQKKPLKNM